ncbi:MAG: hypothetical protein L0332_19200 [Chloroflexi bacterium]|nr:hypothetical protein [Chloroflexota bacterium]MCI0579221.1 hypothetical protein [Chloroflexota bacterium]MCI0644016.1 hypothetical protein [Chloroflexota bacterium]MCI0728824.1 hypothetical protein [Chloroflexota bacterium]
MLSFLNKLRRRKNRTFSWQAVLALSETLTVDLTTHRFCGVAIGDPIEKLSFLGPADNPYDQFQIYNYNKRGFYLAEDDGKLETVVFILVLDDFMPEMRPFVGHWLCNGRTLTITAQTQPKDLQRDLGEPFHEYTESVGDLIWFYEFPGVEWQFAWSKMGQLASVEMGVPELGYAEARALFQVKKQWPF